MRCLLVATVFSLALWADDATIPLEDGSIVVRVDFMPKSVLPEMTYKVKNETSSAWRSIKLHIVVGGLCNDKPRQISIPVDVALAYSKDRQTVQEGKFPNARLDSLDDLVKAHQLLSSLSDCTVDIIKPILVSAENERTSIAGSETKIDLTVELKAIQAERDAEAAAQAKKNAAEAARQKQLAADRKRKEADEAARLMKIKAAEDAKAAEERRRVQVTCGAICQATIDKQEG